MRLRINAFTFRCVFLQRLWHFGGERAHTRSKSPPPRLMIRGFVRLHLLQGAAAHIGCVDRNGMSGVRGAEWGMELGQFLLGPRANSCAVQKFVEHRQ